MRADVRVAAASTRPRRNFPAHNIYNAIYIILLGGKKEVVLTFVLRVWGHMKQQKNIKSERLLIGKTGRILARAEIKAVVRAAGKQWCGLHTSRSGQQLFRLNKSFSVLPAELSFLEISLRRQTALFRIKLPRLVWI